MLKKKLLLCCVMSIVLSACGTNSEASPKEDNSPITMEESVTETPTEKEEGTVPTDTTETVQASDDIQEPVHFPSGCTAYDGEDIYYTEDYSYDSEGRLTRTVRTYNGQEPIITFEASYDEKGNRTHEKIVYIHEQNKSVDSMEISDYVFDEKGSWIERNIKNKDDGDATKVIVNNTYEGDKLVLKDRGNGAYVEYAYDDIGGHTEYHYDNYSFYLEKVFDASDRLLLNEFKMDNFSRVEKFEYDEHGNLTSIYKANYFDEDYSIENVYDENGVLITAYYTSHNSLPNLKIDYRYEDYVATEVEATKDDPFAQYSEFENCNVTVANEFSNELAWIEFSDPSSGIEYTGCIDKNGNLLFYMDKTFNTPVPFNEKGISLLRNDDDSRTISIDKEGTINNVIETDSRCLIQEDYGLFVKTESGFDINKTTYQIYAPDGSLVKEIVDDPENPFMYYNYHGNGIFTFTYENMYATNLYFAKNDNYVENHMCSLNLIDKAYSTKKYYTGKYLLYFCGKYNDETVMTITDEKGNWKDIIIPEEFGNNPIVQDCSERYILLRNNKDFYYVYDVDQDIFKKLDGQYTDRLYWAPAPYDALQEASCSDEVIAILLKGQDGESYVGLYNPETMELLCDPIKGDSARVINKYVIVSSGISSSDSVDVYDLSGKKISTFSDSPSIRYSDGSYNYYDITTSRRFAGYYDEDFNDLFPNGIKYSGAKYINLSNY